MCISDWLYGIYSYLCKPSGTCSILAHSRPLKPLVIMSICHGPGVILILPFPAPVGWRWNFGIWDQCLSPDVACLSVLYKSWFSRRNVFDLHGSLWKEVTPCIVYSLECACTTVKQNYEPLENGNGIYWNICWFRRQPLEQCGGIWECLPSGLLSVVSQKECLWPFWAQGDNNLVNCYESIFLPVPKAIHSSCRPVFGKLATAITTTSVSTVWIITLEFPRLALSMCEWTFLSLLPHGCMGQG